MPTIKAAHRRSEWLASRLLMRELGLTSISYLHNGKPITHGRFFSLSHSGKEVGLVVSDTEIGLDIQCVTEKISIIRSRFCSDTEWQWLQVHPESLRALTIVWSAKEAVFKYYGEEVEFAEDMQVMPFSCTDETIFLHYKGVHGERSFSLRHLTLDGLEVLVAL
jgi:phosphopantetheinyl transferase